MTTTTDVRLKARYKSEIQATLKGEFGYKNPMQIPTLVKIVVNMGVGEAARDSKLIEGAIRDHRAGCIPRNRAGQDRPHTRYGYHCCNYS